MFLLDLFFYGVLSIVPSKAIFGKFQVATTLFSTYTSFLIFGLILWCMKNYEVPLTHLGLGVIVLIIFGTLFLLFRGVYLNDQGKERLFQRFHKSPKWMFKIIGIIYMLGCFICFVSLAIATSKLARS